MRIVWDFIQTQILGMKWLSDLILKLLTAFGADVSSRMWSGVHFFIYDTLKISILLIVLIFIISYIQTHFPPERTKEILSRYNGIFGNIISALLIPQYILIRT